MHGKLRAKSIPNRFKRRTDSQKFGCQSFTFLRWYTKMKKTIEKDRRMELFMEEKDMNQKKKPDDPAEQETGMRKSGLAREGIAYLIFGVLTTVIDYVISNLLYYIWKMDPVPAQTIAWVAAVLFAFVTNKWWVFESHTLNPGKVWREFVSFVLCRVATFLFNLAALFVMVDLMKMEFFLCKLLISVVVVILNYVFSKILIFTNDKKK